MPHRERERDACHIYVYVYARLTRPAEQLNYQKVPSSAASRINAKGTGRRRRRHGHFQFKPSTQESGLKKKGALLYIVHVFYVRGGAVWGFSILCMPIPPCMQQMRSQLYIKNAHV